MVFSRKNALMQALDIAGSFNQSQSLSLSDEVSGLGATLSGQTGSAASVSSVTAGVATITGLTGMTNGSVGNFITFSGANSAGNNGTFLVVNYNSSSSVDISNIDAVASDTNNGSIIWKERKPYSLEDDFNYTRTDRKLIKGTTNWYDAVPTYTRPTATGTNISADLSNIAGKTTDAVAYNVNKAFFGVSVASTNTKVTLSSTGNLKHADSTDETGVPVFDAGPFSGDLASCYVHITDGYSTGAELSVLSGVHAGERIFGVTYAGSSTSPNSVEVRFYSSPFFSDYTTSNTPYTWEAGQSTTINLIYGYNERLDQLDANSFRSVPTLGVLTDGALNKEIKNILSTAGITSTTTSLSGLLTNTSANFAFFNLPNATPTVVDAFNTLNSQIGDRSYSGSILTSGETIVGSLQALSNAIGSSNVTRTIERVSSAISANTAHTLPGGITYTLDGDGNGQNLWVYTRGILRDPGSVSDGNDYSETSTSSVTFYQIINKDDHINYFIKS